MVSFRRLRSSFSWERGHSAPRLSAGSSELGEDVEKGLVNTANISPDAVVPIELHDSIVRARKSVTSREWLTRESVFFSLLLVGIGITLGTIFSITTIRSLDSSVRTFFLSECASHTSRLVNAFLDYQGATAQAHQYVTRSANNVTREGFAALVSTSLATGLRFQVLGYAPRILASQRQALEIESAAYWAANEHLPGYKYSGIRGFEPDGTGEMILTNRSLQDVYYPIHMISPLATNENAIEFDFYSEPNRKKALDKALATSAPSLTARLVLVQEHVPGSYSVLLFQPGVVRSMEDPERWLDVTYVALRIPALLERASSDLTRRLKVFLYDVTTNPLGDYMGGLDTSKSGDERFILEKESESVNNLVEAAQKDPELLFSQEVVDFADRQWLVVYSSTRTFYDWNGIGGTLSTGLCLAFLGVGAAAWYLVSARRSAIDVKCKSQIQRDQAALEVRNAKERAKAERELNEFLAHEVRNPLSVAITACHFVESSMHAEPFHDQDLKVSVIDDLALIDANLHFVNELLRNMLDLNRVMSGTLKLKPLPADIKNDVLMPVRAMLYRRTGSLVISCECPEQLLLCVDRLRLTQIVMNLANNACKFVTEGFIRLRAQVVPGGVEISVEDSGPGIPLEKHASLFDRYQDSLDRLNQGTGIGLHLCKVLSELMGGKVSLDPTFDSGRPGFPGARIVIFLPLEPLDKSTAQIASENLKFNERSGTVLQQLSAGPEEVDAGRGSSGSGESVLGNVPSAYPEISKSNQGQHAGADSVACVSAVALTELPSLETLRTCLQRRVRHVLIVDDSPVIRKLISRSVKRVAPAWTISEASSGEVALEMVASEDAEYDIIIVDQYMAAANKALTGTETILAMRANGVTSTIIGSSANDISEIHLKAGADFFHLKPLPSNADEITRLLAISLPPRPFLPMVVGSSLALRERATEMLLKSVRVEKTQVPHGILELHTPDDIVKLQNVSDYGLIILLEPNLSHVELEELAEVIRGSLAFTGILGVVLNGESPDELRGFDHWWSSRLPSVSVLRREIMQASVKRGLSGFQAVESA